MQAKRIYLTKRNPTIAKADFPKAWLQHAAMPKPGVTDRLEYISLAYCYIEETPFDADDGAGPYDGIALFDLKGLQSVVQALSIPLIPDVVEDELRTFSRLVRECTLCVWSEALLDGPQTAWNIMRFARRGAGVKPTAFREAWREVANQVLAAPLPGLRRLVQNTVVAPPLEEFSYDGVEELWFDTREQGLAGAQDLNARSAAAPQIDLARSRTVLTRVILEKDPAAIARTAALAAAPA